MTSEFWEVQYHGAEASDYFQGAGVAFTPWDEIATGTGDSPSDALADALEQMGAGAGIPYVSDREAHRALDSLIGTTEYPEGLPFWVSVRWKKVYRCEKCDYDQSDSLEDGEWCEDCTPNWDTIVQRFRDEILPYVVAQYGPDDEPARNEAFNNWTDGLCKDGEISPWQYDNETED